MSETLTKNKRLLNHAKVKSWRFVIQLYRSTYKELDQALQQEGVSIARFEILFSIYFNGPTTPGNLSKNGCTSRANATTFLQRMVKDKLVQKVYPEGSKRAVYDLTKRGEELFENLFPDHISRVKKLMPSELKA